MIRFLLDTDHLSLQQRGHPRLAKRLAEHPFEEIGTSVITMEEMIRVRLFWNDVGGRWVPGRTALFQKSAPK